MRIELDPSLFVDADAIVAEHKEALMELMLAARKREQHQFAFTQAVDIERLIERWTPDEAMRTTCRMVLIRRRLATRFAVQPPGITLRVTAHQPEAVDADGRGATVTPERAVALVHQPLSLLLENGINDLAFLQSLIPPGNGRTWFLRALEHQWIIGKNGGGSDMSNQLGDLDAWMRLRTWAMCDAETWYPSNPRQVGGPEAPADQVRTLQAAADEAPRVPLAVLRRRAIENYLPMRALDEWVRHRSDGNQKQPAVEAIRRLDQHRPARFNLRHYYHMERGFQSGSTSIPADYQPFRGEAALEAGLGRAVKAIYKEQIESRGTNAHWLDDAWFAADGHGSEFNDIVYSIMKRV